MTNLIPPLIARFTATSILGVGTLLVAAHTLLAALAAQRATLPPRSRVGLPLLLGGLLSLWFAVAITTADAAHFPLWREDMRPPVSLIVAFLPVILGVALLFTSSSIRALNEAMPSDWLVRIQLYRVLGVILLFPFLYYGTVTAEFALPAALGDMLTGALTPFIGNALAQRRRHAHRWAVAWNLFGILDLIVAPVAAVASGTNAIAMYPLALIPLFMGPPLGILTHVYSLRNLSVAWRGHRAVSAPLNRAEQAV